MVVEFKDYQQYLSPALAKTTELVIERGQGSYIWTVEGERYLDWVQGIAVNALGHSHPRVVRAITEQVQKLTTASFNMVNYPSTLELAKRIAQVAPGELSSIFFSNGGAEATDGALKLARAYTKRPGIIAFKGSFHGRTLGAVSVTASNSKYRKYTEPLVGGIHFASYPSADQCPQGYDEEQRSAWCLGDIRRIFDYICAPDETAAILVEPVQGEGGYVVPPVSFLKGLRAMCDEHGIMLIFDEIQAGYGRTGTMFAAENFGVVPDIMTLGKAIAGGVPASAVLSTEKIMSEWHPGMHGGTFGGNPVMGAAGLAVLDEFAESHILDNVNTQGAYLKQELLGLKERHPIIADVRGLGLMVAIELDHTDGRTGGDLVELTRSAALARHMLTLSCGVKGNGMRMATPLNVTKDVIDEGIAILDESLSVAENSD
ncbi:aspartate aminotransferase family protein [Bifidobacterium sp.]|jgi:4-aminobutyrate aminotransferase|uniref:aspartate aminotransferase family protein n=1 Tax=Bifidobacterium sp. TaxID=41200 RepID=UPI0025B9164C|nr:aspartate aminotransferase family protein [Bifidobacterium sp.]MCH4208816.1 aspartate aminotransferase family protein [Bifidobacterium sp.]MCI1224774.1 aspartate aminotransferase family protein [Bifidobacterium sp.]